MQCNPVNQLSALRDQTNSRLRFAFFYSPGHYPVEIENLRLHPFFCMAYTLPDIGPFLGAAVRVGYSVISLRK